MKLKLTAKEHKLLMAMTYIYGHASNTDEITFFAYPLFKSRGECTRTFSELINKGLVVKDPRNPYRYPACYSLREGLFIPMLKDLMSDDNKDILEKVKDSYATNYGRKPLSQYILYTLQLISGNKSSQIITNTTPPRGFNDELAVMFDDPELRKVFIGLPDDSFIECMVKRLRSALLADDDIDWEYLCNLVKGRPMTNLFGNEGIMSCFNFFYYLGTGKMCTDIEKLPVNVYSLCTAAISLLYKGDYDAAYKLFVKAMTAHNKETKEHKGIFFDDMTNYYFMMSLLLLNNETTLKKFDTLYRKEATFFKVYQQSTFDALYNYFRLHTSPAIDSNLLKRVLDDDQLQAMGWLSWMILNKLGVWPEKIQRPSLTKHNPNAVWLRKELEPTGVIPESDSGDNAFGGSSLFSRLEIKEIWQMKLEEIIQQSSMTASGDKSAYPEQDARIVYILEYGIIDVKYQKRKKNGEWTIGRHIDPRQLLQLKEPWLDDSDMRFMNKLEKWTWTIDTDTHLVDLVGCNHVYADQYCAMPVNIHEDKPFLVIDKRRDGSFSVSAHPKGITENSNTPYICVQNSETDYSVFRPTAYEKKIYSEILSQKKYPAAAEPLLKKLIATIGGRTEVHSNMIVDDEDLKKVDAPTKITLRCMPDSGNKYTFTPMIKAYGSLTFVPGEGAVTTVAEENGKRIQIVRKLRAERENMRLIIAELADIGFIEDEDDWIQTSVTDSYEISIAEFLPLLDWVKENPDICEMEWPENARVKFHPVLNTKGVSINITSKNGWFDVEGDIQIDDRQVISLQKMLELMHASDRSKYIRIGEQEYITLSRDLSKILKRLDTVTTDRRNHLQMSTAAVGLIGDVLDNKDINLKRSKAVDEIRERIENSTKLEPKVPKTLQADLRDYQVAGFEWMSRTTSWGAGVCLADDMGLGKTVQTIALLLEQQAEGPSLIVAPASVVPNWRNELRRFSPTLGVTVLNDAEDRKEAINGAKAGDVVVTTYALLNIEQDDLVAKEWNVVCLDEAHTIKNPGTKMSKAAMQLQAKRKVELTGTPIQNHLSELWNLFQFINPGLLGSFEQFSKKFIMPVEVDHNKERQNQLKRLISPFLLRRTKGDVIEELPEKNEIVVPVELSSEELTMYEVRRRQTVDAVKSSKAVKVSTLAEITRLRQMACSCSLVDKKWKKTSSKIEAFIDLAESLNDSGNRALVFSQFTSFFTEVRKAMDKAKLPYLYLDGSTPMKQREKIVAEFQKGDCPFFLISLKAGGLGLNLTGANYVIHLDPWWNPAIEQQATDRAYRIGQKQDVTVYHLISQHTIEEKILRLHKTKRDLADSLLEGTDMSHALTQEELLELLK